MNLFALINVKENGRSEGMSWCNCGRALEEAFDMLGFNSENSEQRKALQELCNERFCNFTGRIQ